jgi:hypothetical protein
MRKLRAVNYQWDAARSRDLHHLDPSDLPGFGYMGAGSCRAVRPESFDHCQREASASLVIETLSNDTKLTSTGSALRHLKSVRVVGFEH